ncbi:MAG TPA: aromatic ring-hydroxylating dioxygenase subunit alpha [Methylomirabilota bacterium]|jgi:phenylpropionate dioxygenase-like ring-hydroxylating dioxygenase large terminal subunit|nr:aromatic ring-hydroxylating dioxygenase subunit alpha [Methylomirabilota bacterium]
MAVTVTPRAWPGDTLARVPYWVYQDPENYQAELRRIFEGPVWNYVCLESDIEKPGEFRTTFVGEMPVIVVRGEHGEIHAFENRCAHRGALIALEDAGTAKRFQCIYHAWTYNLRGDLVTIAFEKGAHGRGGMPEGFCKDEHGPRKLRTTTLNGLVFASLSDATPPIEQYLGEQVLARVRRVLRKPMRVLGRFVQVLPNNWKLYAENVKDTYHASLLHAFFGTFRLSRFTQGGGVLVSPDGAHHASTTIDRADDRTSTAYRDQGIRSEQDGYRLADLSLLDSVDEFGDGIKLQILTIFPSFVLQQIQNCLAVRQILPKGLDSMELRWTYFGFADDDPAMQRRRLKQSNLVGPAGYVSMEDGCVGGFVQRGAAAAGNEVSVVNMGGDEAESQDTRATEASVRGFWKAYRRYMGY